MIAAAMIAGALILLAGILLGRVLPARRGGGLTKLPAQPKPVCGCRHHHAMHDPGTGFCHAMVNGDAIKYNAFHDPTAWAQVQCPCRQYSGPVPLPSYFAPEITEG